MPTWRTPWANTLRTAGLIFIHDFARSKLSQVARYAIGVAELICRRLRLVFKQEIFPPRDPIGSDRVCGSDFGERRDRRLARSAAVGRPGRRLLGAPSDGP